ncbi:hypothetical protein AMK27_11540 [Streptomyces sp. CB02009]|nr:hypothetical protein AMK27_11540 [Streptomyces sp. CB02009]
MDMDCPGRLREMRCFRGSRTITGARCGERSVVPGEREGPGPRSGTGPTSGPQQSRFAMFRQLFP